MFLSRKPLPRSLIFCYRSSSRLPTPEGLCSEGARKRQGALLLPEQEGSTPLYDTDESNAHRSLRFSYRSQILAESNSAQTFYRLPTSNSTCGPFGRLSVPCWHSNHSQHDWPLRVPPILSMLLRHRNLICIVVECGIQFRIRSSAQSHQHIPLNQNSIQCRAKELQKKINGKQFRNCPLKELDGSTTFPPLLPGRAL